MKKFIITSLVAILIFLLLRQKSVKTVTSPVDPETEDLEPIDLEAIAMNNIVSLEKKIKEVTPEITLNGRTFKLTELSRESLETLALTAPTPIRDKIRAELAARESEANIDVTGLHTDQLQLMFMSTDSVDLRNQIKNELSNRGYTVQLSRTDPNYIKVTSPGAKFVKET